MNETEPTVFIVDDDLALRDSLTELMDVMRIRSHSYATAGEFLAAFDSTRRGCIILDLRLPGMSGVELLEKLTTDRCKLPVIVITGHGNESTKARVLEMGVFDFIEKPSYASRLRESIHKALGEDAGGR